MQITNKQNQTQFGRQQDKKRQNIKGEQLCKKNPVIQERKNTI